MEKGARDAQTAVAEGWFVRQTEYTDKCKRFAILIKSILMKRNNDDEVAACREWCVRSTLYPVCEDFRSASFSFLSDNNASYLCCPVTSRVISFEKNRFGVAGKESRKRKTRGNEKDYHGLQGLVRQLYEVLYCIRYNCEMSLIRYELQLVV